MLKMLEGLSNFILKISYFFFNCKRCKTWRLLKAIYPSCGRTKHYILYPCFKITNLKKINESELKRKGISFVYIMLIIIIFLLLTSMYSWNTGCMSLRTSSKLNQDAFLILISATELLFLSQMNIEIKPIQRMFSHCNRSKWEMNKINILENPKY